MLCFFSCLPLLYSVLCCCRDEADHLVKVIRSRTPALNTVAALSTTKSPTSVKSESKQSGLLAHQTITWKPGDSVYSKVRSIINWIVSYFYSFIFYCPIEDKQCKIVLQYTFLVLCRDIKIVSILSGCSMYQLNFQLVSVDPLFVHILNHLPEILIFL